MTEYSKGSRNMRAETVSNTGGNSGQGPTHPYSEHSHSHSPSHYSQQEHSLRSSAESPEDGFEVAIQYIMPLVSAVKEENEHLKQQREQAQADMQKLGQLAQNLLAENQQMRRHHALRTQDIRKLIQTISINTHEELSDLNHQAFLLRESNHALVKKIQAEMRSTAEADAQIASHHGELNRIHLQSQQDQQAIRDLQIKNKQLFYRCQELQRQTEAIDTAADHQAVQQALVEVVALRNQNKQDVLKAKSLLLQHREEKPFIQENHASVGQQNKQLRAEEQELKETARNGESKLEELKISYGQSVEKFAESFRNYERAKSQLNEGEEELVKVKDAISECKGRVRKNEPLLKQLKEEKQAIKKKIAQKKQAISAAQSERMEIKDKQSKQVKAEITKMKEAMNKHISKITEEMTKKVAPEAATVNNAILHTKQEYAELVQEVQDLEDSIRKLDNPRKEIIRLEYQLKKISNKKN